MLRRTLILALSILAVTASPALAGGDEYTPPSIQAVANADNTATLTGQNFIPATPYTYTVVRQSLQGIRPTQAVGETVDSGSGTIAADGTFEDVTIVLPVGRHLVTVESGDLVATTTLVIGDGGVGAGGLGQDGDLASTGTNNAIPMARVGLALVAAGGMALYAAKKRQGRRAAFVNA